jgi:hypothetical protein
MLPSPSVFIDVPVTRSLVLCVFFCRSLFVLFHFPFGYCVVLYLLRFMDSDYPFGIFKLFLQEVYAQGITLHFITNFHVKIIISNR